MNNTLSYNLIFQPEPEGGFTVTVPALPGCVSYGKTLRKAKVQALDAINGYLAILKKRKQPLPSDNNNFIGSVQIKTASKQKTATYA